MVYRSTNENLLSQLEILKDFERIWADGLARAAENSDAVLRSSNNYVIRLSAKEAKKDSEIYKKANVDRKLFSKIRNNMDYKPSKTTALAFAFALEFGIDES